MTVTALHLVTEAALDLLALYEGLNIRPELPDNLKGGQIQGDFGSSFSGQLDCSLEQVLPAYVSHFNRVPC